MPATSKRKSRSLTKRETGMLKHSSRAGQCSHGPDVKHIGCGGDIAVSGTVHGLTNLGFGFRGGKFVVDATHSRKPTGYSGFCMKCHKEGSFTFHAEAGDK